MTDLVKGNIVIVGGDDRRFKNVYKEFVEYNSEDRTVKVKDFLGNEMNITEDLISPYVRIPENLLTHLGFDKYNGEAGVYFKKSFRVKRMDVFNYEIFQIGKQRKYLSCLFELQNYYRDFTGSDLDVSDFGNWEI